MRVIKDLEQGSDEWHRLRLGKVTASKLKDVMTNARSGDGLSKTAESYMLELIVEIATGKPQDMITNKYIEWGIKTEPEARKCYEFMNDVNVDEVSFIEHNEHIGVSPDGLVGENGVLEIKCPSTKTQLDRYLNNISLPNEYKWQVQGQLWVAEREWCDFVSYDPRLNCNANYICNRIYRDESEINKLKDKVYMFVDLLKENLNKIEGL